MIRRERMESPVAEVCDYFSPAGKVAAPLQRYSLAATLIERRYSATQRRSNCLETSRLRHRATRQTQPFLKLLGLRMDPRDLGAL